MAIRFSHSLLSSSEASTLRRVVCHEDFFHIVDFKEAVEVVDRKKASVSSEVVGSVDGDIVHIAVTGDACVILGRDGKHGIIARVQERMRGKVREGDMLLSLPYSVFRRIPQEDIASLFSEYPSTNSISEKGRTVLKTVVHSEESTFRPVLSLLRTGHVPTWVRRMAVSAKEKRRYLAVIAILAILFAVSIIFQAKRNDQKKRQDRLTASMQTIVQQYEEAVSLLDLNPVRARQLLAGAKEEVAGMMAAFPKDTPEYKEVNEWMQKITNSETAAYKIFTFSEAQPFFDITLIRPQGEGKHIAQYKNFAAILDVKNKALYRLDLSTKKSEILAGSDTVGDATSVSVHGTTAYVVAGQGVVAINDSGKTAKTVIPKDDEWKRIASIVSFAGNIYMLDTGTPTIWKYQSTQDGFSGRIRYVDEADAGPLSEATRMVIDGFVWVLTPSGIRKYASGVPSAFTVTGLEEGIGSFDALYTSDETKELYVLDKTNARIVVLDKDGAYRAQYRWEELRKADDFLVFEEGKKIFILSQNMLYTLDLKE